MFDTASSSLPSRLSSLLFATMVLSVEEDKSIVILSILESPGKAIYSKQPYATLNASHFRSEFRLITPFIPYASLFLSTSRSS
jgi:hypothetical protein